MPSLTPKEQDALGPVSYKCQRCKRAPVKNYCRECDEFYNVCGCPKDPPGTPYGNNHVGHRTY